jgi:hypothetical protein
MDHFVLAEPLRTHAAGPMEVHVLLSLGVMTMRQRSSTSRRRNGGRGSRTYAPRLEWIEARTLLSPVSWTGNAHDNNWDTPGNWSGGAVPGPADDVTISVNANVVHSNNVSDSINSLTSTQPLTISGGTLSIASVSTTSSTLTMGGGTLGGAGNIAVGGLLTIGGSGSLTGSGTVTANSGIALNNSFTFTIDGKPLINPAGQTATWTGGPGLIILKNGATIVNNGTFNVQVVAASAVSSSGNQGAAVAFTNNGALVCDNTSQQTFAFQNVPLNVTSGATVEVQAGTLLIGQSGGAAPAPGAPSRPTRAPTSTSPAAPARSTPPPRSAAPAPSASRAAPRRSPGHTTSRGQPSSRVPR